MTAKMTASYSEHAYEVTDEPDLPVAHNPAQMFRPDSALARFRNGEFEEISISGPFLKDGKPMKARRGFTSFSLDDFDGPQEPLEPMPGWAEVIVSDLMRGTQK